MGENGECGTVGSPYLSRAYGPDSALFLDAVTSTVCKMVRVDDRFAENARDFWHERSLRKICASLCQFVSFLLQLGTPGTCQPLGRSALARDGRNALPLKLCVNRRRLQALSGFSANHRIHKFSQPAFFLRHPLSLAAWAVLHIQYAIIFWVQQTRCASWNVHTDPFLCAGTATSALPEARHGRCESGELPLSPSYLPVQPVATFAPGPGRLRQPLHFSGVLQKE